MKHFLIFILCAFIFDICYSQTTIKISGRVTDFDENPVDSSVVKILTRNFETIAETYSDKNGFYKIENLEKGHYMAMYAIRMKEYPRFDAVPDDEKRLEFWAWNIVADRDLTINPRYHKLELYGTTVFEIFGGYRGLFVYFRPMSVTKNISYSREIYMDKGKAEKTAEISVKPENLKVRIYADDELLKINSIQPVTEFEGTENMPQTAYLVQVDAPKTIPSKPYVVFRIEAENTEFGEKGENLYFYELKNYNR
jgi:hypothetical protein